MRKLVQRVEEVSGHDWRLALARESHVSECILYGTYVDDVLGEGAPVSATPESGCRLYWDDRPLTAARLAELLASLDRDQIALCIQSTSGTPLDVRRQILDALLAWR